MMAPWRSSFLAKGRRSDTARFHDHEAMSSDHEDFESSDVLLEKSVRSEIVRHRPYWRTIRLGNVMEYAVIVAIGLVNCLGLVLLFTGHIRIALVDTTALPPESKLPLNRRLRPPLTRILATVKAITPKVFSPSTPFTVSSEDKGFAAWKSLTNNIDIGSAYVPKNDLHGLFHSELNSTIPGYQMYPVSMYHQLHCLVRIATAASALNCNTNA